MKILKGEILKLRFERDYEGNYFLYSKNGEIVMDYYNVEGDIYTEEQIDNALYEGTLFICEDCGEYHYTDNSYYIEDMQKYVCDNCISDYYCCYDCGNYYSRDSVQYVEDIGDWVCDNCIDRGGYDICEACGNWYTTDYMHFSEEDYCYYCDNCFEDDGNIYQYHNFSNWAFYKTENDTSKFYIGYELEVDNGNDNINASDCVYNNLNAVCMHDGSLDTGFEIVSHPQTYQYIMEHKESIKKTMESLINYGYESHNSDTCGLHFHVTAPKDNRQEIVSRLWAVLEFYKNEVVKLSRRKDSQLHWCKWLTDDKDLKSIEYYHIKGMSKDYTRYLAINDTNNKTIEFRFFRGTLRFDTFMAAIQFINNLYTLASDLSIKLQDITWDKLIEGEYIRQYAIEHGILTNDIIIDNYEAISKYDYNVQYFYNRVIKMLEKMERKWVTLNINQLQKDGDMYSIMDKISYMNENSKIKVLNESKRYFTLKEYKKAVDILDDCISDYIRYYKNGANDILLNYTSCYDNINKLEEVILCA